MDSLNLSPYFTTIQCSKVKIHVSLFLHPGASTLYLSLFTLVKDFFRTCSGINRTNTVICWSFKLVNFHLHTISISEVSYFLVRILPHILEDFGRQLQFLTRKVKETLSYHTFFNFSDRKKST